MTCQECEPLIALYVEGDIEDRGLERHLAGCAECRELLEDLRASQALLKELPGADPALLLSVRSSVLSRMGERRRLLWPWVAALTSAAALLAIVFRPGLRQEIPVAPRAPVHVAAAPAAPAMPVLMVRRRSRPRARKRAAAKEPLVVKMLTDDPNIVIIWLVGQPGD
jgi:hypothetical protein